MADDDGETEGAEMYIGSATGRDSYLTGRNFTIYSGRASANDNLDSLAVRGLTTRGDTTTTDFAANPDITEQSDGDNSTEVTLGTTATVSFESGGVSIATKQSRGASAKVMLTTAVTGSSAGNLPYNKTGATGAGDNIDTEITVRVTAANGYNDHDYTFSAARTAPVGNAAEITVNAGSAVTFANGVGTATIDAAATEAAIAVDLTEGQTVKASSGSDGLTGVAGEVDATIITFTVATAVGQTTVKVTVTSEDGVDNVRTVNVVRPSS